jgi:hypothetical protein
MGRDGGTQGSRTGSAQGRRRQMMTAYEIPIGTELVIGKRCWKLVHRMKFHPDMMRFRETTAVQSHPMHRAMYPSEVQAMIDAGFKIHVPGPEDF